MINETITKKYVGMFEAVKILGKPSHTIWGYSKRLEPFKEYGHVKRGKLRGVGAELQFNQTQLAWLKKMISIMDSGYYTMLGGVHFTYHEMIKTK